MGAKSGFIILFIIILIGFGIWLFVFNNSLFDNFSNKTNLTNPIPNNFSQPKLEENYVVITRLNQPYFDIAEYFSNVKNAKLLSYTSDFNEVMPELKRLKPTFIAIILPPNDLTVDFVDLIDDKIRDIDEDPFYDSSYGFISGFTPQDTKDYIDRILQFSPLEPSIYHINGDYNIRNLKDFRFKIKEDCVKTEWATCEDGSEEILLNNLKNNLNDYNILFFFVHGTPSELVLGYKNSEKGNDLIVGDDSGLKIKESSGYDCHIENQGGAGTQVCEPIYSTYSLQLKDKLIVAESCTTARIIGKPSEVKESYLDSSEAGKIETSLILASLKSGAIGYMGASHVANSAIFPQETLIPESILGNIPVGTTLKHLKNNYVASILYQSEDKEASPKADDFTLGYINFQTKNWIFFGDPSIVISKRNIRADSCLQSYSEEELNDKKIINFDIQFTKEGKNLISSKIFSKFTYEGSNKFNVQSADVCVVPIKLERIISNYKLESVDVNQRFKPFLEKDFIFDAGDELIIFIPNYITKNGGNEVSSKFTLEIE